MSNHNQQTEASVYSAMWCGKDDHVVPGLFNAPPNTVSIHSGCGAAYCVPTPSTP
eukprot:m.259061 g.259061  ORF g.259061 m.259061 type:complete len:55 (+) comp81677_c0_seq1:95-259(+)